MDDQLQDLLGSITPETMEQMRRMAQSLFGGEAEEGEGNPESPPSGEGAYTIDPEILAKLSAILNRRQPPDSRATLIEAIKPHLTEPHRRKADQAIGFLRAMELLPLLREVGL
ncbi:MAG: hypothetical protein LBJ12_07215 [Oscillospiraceae bacterium]|jgi:hypothetical protein|nr:hypothetical protein [Oscillospiraceae bacterium]